MGIKSFSRARAIHVMLVYTGGCNGCDIEIVNSILSPRFDAEHAGSCALMGGVYKNCYGDIPSEEIEGPVENIIPVNAKVPGCAVRPQDVLAGVVSLLPTLLDAD